MDVYYITGTSKGIGLALAEKLLEDENNLVIGIARNCEISHPNYIHKNLDLSDINEVSRFRFGDHLKAENVSLINNAGTLGNVKYVGELENDDIVTTFNINLLAPSVLMNSFLRDYSELDCDKVILNISSGAATSVYDGWSGYCTTKAGINMMTAVVKSERSLRNDFKVKIVAVAPGIIETDMQVKIRKTDAKDFSIVDKFHDIKNDGISKTPAQTAEALIEFISTLTDETPSFVDLRD